MSVNKLSKGEYRITVYNGKGNLVTGKQVIIASESLNGSINCDQRFSSGMYVMKITGYGKSINSKFIVL